jgi:hypothetical protein
VTATTREVCDLLLAAERYRRARRYQEADKAAGHAVELLATELAARERLIREACTAGIVDDGRVAGA